MHPAQARHVLPEFTERTGDGTRTLDPYSKLLGERIIMLGTPVDDACASDVVAQLMYLEHAAPDRPISLYLNSPGGSFSAMTAVYDTLRYVTCEVETVCLGQAASVAAVLLAAGTPGRRLALPGARVVLSQPALAEPVQGQPSDLAIQAQELLRARETLQTLLSRHTGRSREQIGRDVERDTVLDAAGALEFGLVDRISVPRAQQSGTGLGS
ncbi:ATP-dependent Clp protease proteolytic subunit [Streptomyces sp. XM4193]|uniref:ATP-dependent Clp protease proteolytic subunit n=1 Tax=Streptomyces sp. XM4193 TaxID=2929782 RepID=UPI001FF8ADDD|nr:ATP-dependent Clp protease proteolytic subunit [Streptomyces sp. XM4193]MCK1797982.1 ATP-dependent Clp protease proteolytic subunit [Streptomyces sp. XM4193]